MEKFIPAQPQPSLSNIRDLMAFVNIQSPDIEDAGESWTEVDDRFQNILDATEVEEES